MRGRRKAVYGHLTSLLLLSAIVRYVVCERQTIQMVSFLYYALFVPGAFVGMLVVLSSLMSKIWWSCGEYNAGFYL